MRSRGFSLLEALVTLVIVAMVTTVLMQSLFQVLGLRERVLRVEREARVAALQERWFRESVAGLVADLPEREGAFRGSAEAWSGSTLAAPSTAGLRRIEWRLAGAVGQRSLQVREEGAAPRSLRPVSDQARMQYLDPAGVWHAQWPPAEAAASPADSPALPRALRLDDPGADSPWLWSEAVPAGPGLPQPLRVMLEPADAAAF